MFLRKIIQRPIIKCLDLTEFRKNFYAVTLSALVCFLISIFVVLNKYNYEMPVNALFLLFSSQISATNYLEGLAFIGIQLRISILILLFWLYIYLILSMFTLINYLRYTIMYIVDQNFIKEISKNDEYIEFRQHMQRRILLPSLIIVFLGVSIQTWLIIFVHIDFSYLIKYFPYTIPIISVVILYTSHKHYMESYYKLNDKKRYILFSKSSYINRFVGLCLLIFLFFLFMYSAMPFLNMTMELGNNKAKNMINFLASQHRDKINDDRELSAVDDEFKSWIKSKFKKPINAWSDFIKIDIDVFLNSMFKVVVVFSICAIAYFGIQIYIIFKSRRANINKIVKSTTYSLIFSLIVTFLEQQIGTPDASTFLFSGSFVACFTFFTAVLAETTDD